jgi:hypothetical protein
MTLRLASIVDDDDLEGIVEILLRESMIECGEPAGIVPIWDNDRYDRLRLAHAQ